MKIYKHILTNDISYGFEINEGFMKANYNKLWKLLIDKKMNKTQLQDRVGMSPTTLAKMGRDENVSMDVLLRICKVLQCDIGDILEAIPDEE